MFISEEDETEAAEYRYTPYGEWTITRGGVAQGSDPLGQDVGYTGRWYDEESGLWQYRARAFSTRIGRFIQRDSLGLKEGPNLYQYVRSAPTNHRDPSGLTVTGPDDRDVPGTNPNSDEEFADPPGPLTKTNPGGIRVAKNSRNGCSIVRNHPNTFKIRVSARHSGKHRYAWVQYRMWWLMFGDSPSNVTGDMMSEWGLDNNGQGRGDPWYRNQGTSGDAQGMLDFPGVGQENENSARADPTILLAKIEEYTGIKDLSGHNWYSLQVFFKLYLVNLDTHQVVTSYFYYWRIEITMSQPNPTIDFTFSSPLSSSSRS